MSRTRSFRAAVTLVAAAAVALTAAPLTGVAAAAPTAAIARVSPNVGTTVQTALVVEFDANADGSNGPDSWSAAPAAAQLTLGSTTIAGTSLTATATRATATFNLSGQPTGTYSARLAGGTANLTTVASCTTCFTLSAGAVPTLSSVSPSSRAQGSGTTSLALTGTGFQSGATVSSSSSSGITFGTATVNSPTSITVPVTIASSAATGARNLTVTNTSGGQPAGSGSCTGCFTVTPGPTVTGISPAAGLNTGSRPVTITGTGFLAPATVKLQHTGQPDIPGSGVVVNSPTSLSATFDLRGAAPLSGWDVVVSSNGGSGQLTGAFTVAGNQPAVSAASPSSRPVGASAVNVVLTGSGFANGATVAIGGALDGVTVNSVSVASPTQITANVSVSNAASPGPRTVTVTNADGQTSVDCTCFSVSANPTVSSVSPSTAGLGATGRSVTITGTGFAPSLDATSPVTVSGTGVTVTNVVRGSATSITATLAVASGAATGSRSLTVRNSDGGTGTLNSALTVTAPPTVSAISPSNRAPGSAAGTLDITPAANGVFVDGTTVALSPADAAVHLGTPVYNALTGHLTVPVTVDADATPGARTLLLTNLDGGTATTTLFSVGTAPTITSVSPASLGQGGSRTLTITGSGFASGVAVDVPAAEGTTAPDGVTVSSTTLVSPTRITVTLAASPTAGVGPRDLRVTNSAANGAGTATSAAAFAVTAAPGVTGLTPSTIGQGASHRTVVVTGTDFAGTPAVSFSGSGLTVDSVTRDSATQLTLSVSAASTAQPTTVTGRDITVVNPDSGTSTATGVLTVNAAPNATSVSPSSAPDGATTSVTISGSGFSSSGGLPTVTVSGTGVAVSSVAVVSATQLTATFAVAPSAAMTQRSVSVVNPDGGVPATSTATFTVTGAPTVTGLSPSVVSNSGTAQRTISATGTAFANGAAFTLAKVGQSTVTATSSRVTSATAASATFAVTALAPGAWDFVVVNPDGSTGTCFGCFTVVGGTPTITSVTPSAVGQGATARPVSLLGSSFSQGMTVAVAGAGASLSDLRVLDSSHATAALTVAPDAAVGPRSVVITTTDGQTSTAAEALAVVARPVITALSPSTRAQGTTTSAVAVVGSGLTSSTVASVEGTGVTLTLSDVANGGTTAFGTLTVSPGAALGLRDVTLDNPDGGTSVGADQITVTAPPTVTGLDSSVGQGASAKAVTITGTGFGPGAVVSFPSSADLVAGTATVAADGLSLTVPVSADAAATPGARDVRVTNTDGGSATQPAALTITAKPTLSSLSVTSKGQGASVAGVTLTGTGFQTGMSLSLGDGITVTDLVRSSATTATADLAVAGTAPVGSHAATVTNADGGSSTSPDAFTVVAAPVLTGITPHQRVQGTEIDVPLEGTGFAPGMTLALSGTGVTVSGLAVTGPTAATAHLAVAANAPLGDRAATLTNADGGTSTLPAAFTVTAAPSVVSAGQVGQGAVAHVVTVTGTGFQPGAVVSASGTGLTLGATTVAPGGLSLTVPVTATGSAPTGTRDLVVTNPDEGSALGAGVLTVAAKPVATSLPGAVGQGAASQARTLSGTGFVAGTTVGFSDPGISSTVTYVSGTALTTAISVTSAVAPQAADVTVVNPDGGQSTATGLLAITAGPAVTTVTPSALGQGGSESVTVSGSGLQDGLSLSFGLAVGVTDVSVAADGSSVTATLTATDVAIASARDLTVVNPDGGRVTKAAALTVTDHPTASGAAPATIGQGAVSRAITVTGAHFDATPTVSVSGTGVTVDWVTRTSDTALALVLSAADDAATGGRDVTITNPDRGTVVVEDLLAVVAHPVVTGASPASVGVGATSVPVLISGSGLADGATLAFDDAAITGAVTQVTGGTAMSATVTVGPAAALGSHSVTVLNTDGGRSTAAGFLTVTVAPHVTALSRDSLGRDATASGVSISGTGFVPGTQVAIQGVQVSDVAFVSATELTATLLATAAAPVSDATVTATNPDHGTSTSTGLLAITPKPVVTSVTPAVVGQGGSRSVALTGSGFATGLVLSLGSGTVVSGLVVTDTTHATATVAVDSDATPGARAVGATNPDGGASQSSGLFAVSAKPTVTSVSPKALAVGSSRTVTLTGTGLVSGALVAFSGTGVTAGRATSGQGGTTLTVPVSVASDAATTARSVTVTNPDRGSGTLASALTVDQLPTITSVTPVRVTQGRSYALKVTGTGFRPGATLSLGGGVTHRALALTGSAVSTTVDVATSAAAGKRALTLTNSDGGRVVCAACLTVRYRTSVTLKRSATAVTAGRSATLSGTLSRTYGGRAVAGRTVTLYRKAHGAATYSKAATTTTSSTGAYAFTQKPTRTTSYYVTSASTGTYAPVTSSRVSVAVRPAVRVVSPASGSSLKQGSVLTVVASVSPDLHGTTAELMLRHSDGSLSPLTAASIGSGGRVTLRYRAKSKGSYGLVVRVRATAGTLEGRSSAFTVRVV